MGKEGNVGRMLSQQEFEAGLDWARGTVEYGEKVREYGRGHPGFLTEQYLIGNVLEQIEGDDFNCYAWRIGGVDWNRVAYLAPVSREQLLIRLRDEASLEELPWGIKGMIKDLRGKVESEDWRDEQVFERSKARWLGFRAKLREMRQRDSGLQQCVAYYDQMSPIVLDELGLRQT